MKGLLLILSLCFYTEVAHSLPKATGKQSITIFGRAESMIAHNEMRVSDIAEVKSLKMEDDDAVIGIKKIVIASSPKPGDEIVLSANDIIERLRNEGVNLEEVGYSFPRTMKVKRAGREVSQSEIVKAIESYLETGGREAEVKQVQFKPMIIEPNTPVMLSVASETRSGTNSAEFKINLDGSEKGSLSVRALLDEWVNMPIAKRSLSPGEVLEEGDVTFGKVSYASYPRSGTLNLKDLVGKKVDSGIKQGEPIKTGALSNQKLVSRNSKVIPSKISKKINDSTRFSLICFER